MAILISLAALLLLTMPLHTTRAGTLCKCRNHSAEAEANGTCSRTEDKKYCTLKFSATPPSYRDVFVEFIEEINTIGLQVTISTDVVEALRFAFTTSPDHWDEDTIRHFLPLLFAISQREIYTEDPDQLGLSDSNYHFRDTTFSVARFIDANAEDILKYWGDTSTLVSNVDLHNYGGVSATISYGCIQLRFDDGVETMVKTRFSLGGYFCTDTDPYLYPEWYRDQLGIELP